MADALGAALVALRAVEGWESVADPIDWFAGKFVVDHFVSSKKSSSCSPKVRGSEAFNSFTLGYFSV